MPIGEGAFEATHQMDIRPIKPGDKDEWGRMRANLYTNPDTQEIEDWFRAKESGGTPLVGVAVFVADRGDGRLAGFVEIGSRNYVDGCETSPVAYNDVSLKAHTALGLEEVERQICFRRHLR